jgi:CheY-like chemotaxis protein/anti-sigma regulatory factor (Ser/Thr protein kinase)
VEEVAAALRDSAARKGLELRIDYAGEIPETIHNDPTRLRQILLNLVSNAIKFTETGHVALAVRTIETADGQLRIEFEVTDTGVGMSPRELRRVFEPFSQADESTSRHYGGTGLGLTITRRLAELLGGQVRASSTPGQGSSFTVSVDPGNLDGVRMLEAPRSQERAPQPEREQGRLRGRVLVAEDGADNQRLVRTMLERVGLEVDLAENGRVALEMVLAGVDSGAPYDLVLMDIQMPEMDGHEATRELRRAGYSNPILALTAHAMESDRQRCLDVGCDDVCTKPIDRRDLLRKLESYLQKGSEG